MRSGERMSQTRWWQEAWEDIAGAARRRWLWTALARGDLRRRYFGSSIGSLWAPLNLALMVGAIVLVFAERSGENLGPYAAYVTIGLVLWQFLQSGLNDAGQAFISASDTIRQTAMPLTIHIFRLVWRQLLLLLPNAAIVAIVLAAFGIVPSREIWSLVPALLLLVFTLFWSAVLLGLMSARFRDVPQIVGSLLQLLFFLTPVFWMPAQPGVALAWLASLNPLFAFIDLVRAPLLGGVAAPHSWPIALAVSAAIAAAGFVSLGRSRASMAYWI